MDTNKDPDNWARRRMAAWKSLPEPRVAWEDFKRFWTIDKHQPQERKNDYND